MADDIQQARIEIARTRNIPPEQVPQKQAEQRILSQKTTLPKPQLSVTVAPPKPTSTNYNTADYVATPQGQLVSKADLDPYAGLSDADRAALARQAEALKKYGKQIQAYTQQGAPTITLSSGDKVLWSTYKDLPPETQKLLLETGSVEAYNATVNQMAIQAETEFKANTIQLPSGEIVSRDAYNSLSEEQKQVLFDEGVGALQGLIEVQQYAGERAVANLQAASIEAQKAYEAQIAALPEADRKYIEIHGVEAYNEQVTRQVEAVNQSLERAKDYITDNPDGTQSIDIVAALQGQVLPQDLKNLGITDQQIADAYLATPGFNTAPQTIPLNVVTRGKIGGHEVFEELIPYTNETGTQVNAVQYLVDTNLDPNSVKVLQQVVADKDIASALVTANAITLVNQYQGDVVQLTREMPDSAPQLMAQAGYNPTQIEEIQALAVDTSYVTKTEAEQPKNIWQTITGFIGETAEQLKNNFIGNFTGDRHWETPEGQAELKARYESQQAKQSSLGGVLSNVFLEDDRVYYDASGDYYFQPKIGYIDISPAGSWGKSQQIVSKVAKNVVKLQDASDLGYSEAKFLDFLRARVEIPGLTPAEFDKLDDLQLARILAKSKSQMTDIEIWARSKDINKAWNEIVLRKLMDKITVEQQQSANLAKAARQLKETGQVVLQTPQISTIGINPALVVIVTGKAATSAVIDTIDAVSNVAMQINPPVRSVPTPIQTKQFIPDIKPVVTIAPIQTPISTGATQTDISVTTKPIISTEIFPSTAPLQKPAEQPMPEPTITNRPQPMPDLGISGATETQVKPDAKTDTDITPELDVTTSTLPITTPAPITTPSPAPVPQPFPQPSLQPQSVREPVDEYQHKPPGEKDKKQPPPPFIPDEDKKREDWEEEYSVDGSIAWKQGFGWWVIKPPYKGREDMHFFYGSPPEGVHAVEGGAESAFKSIQSFGGVVPDNLLVDLGIMNIKISNPKGTPGAGKIEYDEDERQAKHWAREPYGKRSFTEEVEQAPARRNTSSKVRKVDIIEEIDETGRYYLGRRLPDNLDLA